VKVVQWLQQRREHWKELESLCDQLEHRQARQLDPSDLVRFSSLYRAACADLALADAYQLPYATVQYLHRLVGRAHNQLYRSRQLQIGQWLHTLMVEVPQRVFQDACVQVAFCVFWGVFALSGFLSAYPQWAPGFAQRMIGDQMIERLETDFAHPPGHGNSSLHFLAAGFYILHNTGIGLRCFATGLLVVPGLITTIFNGAFLGACFGYMARPDVAAGANFYNFVTAHGPFELTAIVLSAGAGLRLGVSWLSTGGLGRLHSLQKAAKESMPIMGTAMLLFFLAAIIEGFLSPTRAAYAVKAVVALLSSGLLMFYFVVLGFPRSPSGETGPDSDRDT
jgi:uncharacterized membrane protein SpoIIM required for sporulation